MLKNRQSQIDQKRKNDLINKVHSYFAQISSLKNHDLDPLVSSTLGSSSVEPGKDERLLANELKPELTFFAARVRFLRKLRRFLGFSLIHSLVGL